ncbi:MAG: DEAD/DEAH box helicase [bacterium]|nr:DEAD/DEAH box helicase [bacterium]
MKQQNPEFDAAMKAMEETNDLLFITGQAGTGKSTLLQEFRSKTKKQLAVLAPTGVAALNVYGQTIHSFFGFPPEITPASVHKLSKKYAETMRAVETIIIDEISMVRADLLDCIDASLRIHRNDSQPFGGVQMIFIGDLYQLPPVLQREERAYFSQEYASPYFFSAHVLEHAELQTIELKHVYRQTDDRFLDLLRHVRARTINNDHVAVFNERVDSKVEALDHIHVTTTNKAADDRNRISLDRLSGKAWVFDGDLSGSFGKRTLPAPAILTLKEGARVMMTNNDGQKRWVNGSIGVVKRIKKELGGTVSIEVKIGEKTETVKRHSWEKNEYFFDEEEGGMNATSVGSFTQFPLTLAWAVTIHKSQGKTFDKVVIDMGRGAFAHGQFYVALSRARTLDGIILRQPFRTSDIILDQHVANFFAGKRVKNPEPHIARDTAHQIGFNLASQKQANSDEDITYEPL